MNARRARGICTLLQSLAPFATGCREPVRTEPEESRAAAISPVTAVVTAVKGSLESVLYSTVVSEFTNRADRPVTLVSYEITWPGGRFVVSNVDLTLAPGHVTTRKARVDAMSNGSFTPQNTRVVVIETR